MFPRLSRAVQLEQLKLALKSAWRQPVAPKQADVLPRTYCQSHCTSNQTFTAHHACDQTRSATMLMCINVMTPFSLRDSNQRTACARSVRVSPHVCCQVFKVQVPVSNIVADDTGSRFYNTSIHKYPPSVSCHVTRCSIPSQTQFTHDETQRVATKPDFHQQKNEKKRKKRERKRKKRERREKENKNKRERKEKKKRKKRKKKSKKSVVIVLRFQTFSPV